MWNGEGSHDLGVFAKLVNLQLTVMSVSFISDSDAWLFFTEAIKGICSYSLSK